MIHFALSQVSYYNLAVRFYSIYTYSLEFMHFNRGAFIVIEGLDRAGKSSQCSNLAKVYNEKGIKARNICFPGLCIFELNNDIQIEQQQLVKLLINF